MEQHSAVLRSFGLTFAQGVQGISRSWGNLHFRFTSSTAVLILRSGMLFYRSAKGRSWIDAVCFSESTAYLVHEMGGILQLGQASLWLLVEQSG